MTRKTCLVALLALLSACTSAPPPVAVRAARPSDEEAAILAVLDLREMRLILSQTRQPRLEAPALEAVWRDAFVAAHKGLMDGQVPEFVRERHRLRHRP